MDSLRIVKDDLLKDWLYFRDENFCSLVNAEDRKHMIKFDGISDSILKSIPKQNRPFVQKQLNKFDDNVMDYIGYWNEKYFRNGFCDGKQKNQGTFNSLINVVAGDRLELSTFGL